MRPPWPIIGRTAWPSCRVAPVTSTLGLAFNMASSHKWPRDLSYVPGVARVGHAHKQPSSSQGSCPGHKRTGCAKKLVAGAPRRPATSADSVSTKLVVVGASRQRAAPRSQFRGRAALGGPSLLRQRRAGGAVHSRCSASTIGAQTGLRPFSAGRHRPKARCMPPARPNRSFKGTRNGMPPWPRGRLCLSSAARPGRHAAARPLTLR